MAAWKAQDHHLDLTVDWKQDKNNKKPCLFNIPTNHNSRTFLV